MESFIVRTAKKALHIPTSLPPFVQIEITNICNLRCKMCPRHHVSFAEQHMDMETIRNIIDRLEGVSEVSLVGLGEPLANPRLTDAIRYSRSRGLKVKTTTNGLLLTSDQKCEELIDSGLDSITFSLESIHDEPDAHSAAHQNSRAVRNIKRLIALRRKRGSGTPRITLQAIMIRSHEQDIYDISRWGATHGVDRINVIRMTVYFETGMERPNEEEERAIFKELARLRRQLGIRIDCIQDQFYDGLTGFVYKHAKPLLRLDAHCPRLLDYPYITMNGDVTPCCVLPEYSFGNILKTGLREIWHGTLINNFRENHHTVETCSKCDNFRLKQLI